MKTENLVVLLGNPGRRYENTRHNAGVIVGETLALPKNVKLVKPTEFMNNSGIPVFKKMKWHKIPPEKVILIFDDINLPVGKIRIRRNGSDGGHKGMRSVIEECGSENFPRIKIGIGGVPERWTLVDWVLSRFTGDEIAYLKTLREKVQTCVEYMLDGNIEKAMNVSNL
ncbi:MAG: aminoacyl-tRNA hydrolase [Ruminococcus sp.]|jgi:PTH1 family peptidyl-tRNA hydrolase|nr:aminoacyl-tRNA hydrolase [Ruminococcus sp.]